MAKRVRGLAAHARPVCEAAGRPGQRFVPVRSIDNQAELMRHRARELLAGQRTAGDYQEFRVWPERLNLFMPLPG